MQLRSSDICHKLLSVCYYYSRCFGTVTHCITRIDNNDSDHSLTHESSRVNSICYNYHKTTTSIPIPGVICRSRFAFQACEQGAFMWFHIISRCICCVLFFYLALGLWTTDDPFYTRMVIGQAAFIAVCPIISSLLNLLYRQQYVLAINALMRLMQRVEKFLPDYEIFQWTHVALVALKLMSFVYEIACAVYEIGNAMKHGTPSEIAATTLEMYLMIGVWLSLHVTSLLYICIDALYNALNNYMKLEFIPRLNEMQANDPTSVSKADLQHLSTNWTTFSDLLLRVQRVGLQLHYLWQIPVVTAALYVYCGSISAVYYMIWQYYELGDTHTRLFIFMLKLLYDIALLSLTGHRTIKASRLIRCMGLENAILVEQIEWHRQIELFLYHINLSEFKLNIFGLFDIGNALTLTFISGIFTAISIFIPFSIKAYRMQKFLETRN